MLPPPSPARMNGAGKQLDFNNPAAAAAISAKPIGMLRITVVEGRGLKMQQELFNIDTPDVYCKITFGVSSKV